MLDVTSSLSSPLTGLGVPVTSGHDGVEGDEARHLSVLVKGLGMLAPLSVAETELLCGLVADARYHPPGRGICVAGAPLPGPRLVVAGWACRYRTGPDNSWQIVALRLPGDLLWPLPPFPCMPSPCSVATLTGLETVSAALLAEAAAVAEPAHPGLARATRLMAHLDEALLCGQVLRLGRLGACERLAHLMLELRERLTRVGLARPDGFAMPLTQDVLADALGLSVVHVNRTLQQLRRDGLLDIKGGVVQLLDPEGLQRLANWAPSPHSNA